MHSKYSDDELYLSDESFKEGVAKYRVGIAVQHKDQMGYVDKMTNRLNDTDLRLLRHSVNRGEGED